MNKIKQLRIKCGLTQQSLSDKLNIPKRTIQDWESGARHAPDYVVDLIVDKMNNNTNPMNNNANPAYDFDDYFEAVKTFCKDSAEWGGLDDNLYYTSDGSAWIETSDNANGGLDVSWAFKAEVTKETAAEKFAELIKDLIINIVENWLEDDPDFYADELKKIAKSLTTIK